MEALQAALRMAAAAGAPAAGPAGNDVADATKVLQAAMRTMAVTAAMKNEARPPYTLPPRHVLRGEARPLPQEFPRLKAYTLSYEANRESLAHTLESFRATDWGEDPVVFMQPPDWPPGRDNGSKNYKRILQHAATDGCDFALIFEDDVRFCRHLRHNLSNTAIVRRDQCDYLSLFMPDLIASPWERREPHLGYRLAKPLYSGPNQLWEKYRIWGAQAYLLSKRFVVAALSRWERLVEGQDTRVVSVCSEMRLPMWYTAPCLVEHAPLHSVFGTPTAYAPDFDPDFRLGRSHGFQPPEEIPGWLSFVEGKLLWQMAAGRDVLEVGTACGRATVCLAQQARRVLSVDSLDQAEAAEWVRRYGAAERAEFRRGDVNELCQGLGRRFGLALVDTEHDAASVVRDIEAVRPLLEPGGLIAFHDYPDPSWPHVRLVVDDYARRLGWKRIAQADYLGVFSTPVA